MSPHAEVIVYSKDYCPYCDAAKNLLKAKGVSYQEIDITNDSEVAEKLWSLVAPQKTVPQIVVGGKPLGGFMDIKALEDQGLLDQHLFPQKT